MSPPLPCHPYGHRHQITYRRRRQCPFPYAPDRRRPTTTYRAAAALRTTDKTETRCDIVSRVRPPPTCGIRTLFRPSGGDVTRGGGGGPRYGFNQPPAAVGRAESAKSSRAAARRTRTRETRRGRGRDDGTSVWNGGRVRTGRSRASVRASAAKPKSLRGTAVSHANNDVYASS